MFPNYYSVATPYHCNVCCLCNPLLLGDFIVLKYLIKTENYVAI